MSVATVAIVVEGALLAVALLFVVALLRSHAEILRRLAALEPDQAPQRRPPAAPVDATVSDIAGQTLAGDAVKLGLGPGSPRTLLAFLSSGCAACGPLWDGLHEPVAPPVDASLAARLVVVTKGPDRERLARLLELAPDGVEVVMSTAAWEAFGVPATPHFVLVDGEVGIRGRGSATSWAQIGSLLKDAGDDAAIHEARSTRERAVRAEWALAAAGISEGHPSLHPSRPASEAEL